MVIVHGTMFLLAVLILLVRMETVETLFKTPKPWSEQLLYGVLIGLASSVIATLVGSRWNLLKEVGEIVELILQVLKPSYLHLFLISLASGIIEELLFRAALQPVIGLWWAAFLFMLAHGLAPIRLQALLVYLSILFAAGVWLGIAYERLGLLGAMTIHTVHNCVVFAFALRQFRANNPNDSSPQP